MGPEQQVAFENLKRCLISAQVLIHPDYSKPFMLITDAGQVGMRAVLCHLREGFLSPLRYISKTFNSSQRNYTTTERECLAIIESIKILRPLLFGSRFIVVMDHSALKHLREFKDLSSRVMRWATYLAPLTFGIKFRPGVDNISDSLSRLNLEDLDFQSAKYLEQQAGLNYLSLSMSNPDEIKKQEDDFQESVDVTTKDKVKEHQETVMNKPPPDQKMLRWLQWVENWLLTRKWMMLQDPRFQSLPRDWKRSANAQKQILKLEGHGENQELYIFHQGIWKTCLHAMELYAICQEMHEEGHQSWSATAMLLKKEYYAPHLMEITKSIVSGCDICKRYAQRMKKLVELLSQFQGFHPFAQVSMDFIGPLEKTASGNKHIMLIVDHNTQYAVAVALPDTSAELIGVVLVKELFYKFGLPDILGSDKASYSITEMLKNAYERLQIFKRSSLSYHPQTSGLVEKTNGTIMKMLKKTLNQKKDWDVLLDEVFFFYNTTPKKTFKGFSPFELLYGFFPRLLNREMKTTRKEIMTQEAFDKFIETRQDLFLRTQGLFQVIIAEKAKATDNINEKEGRLPSRAKFFPDDLVFLDKYPVFPDKPSKLEPRYWGPYIVTDVLPLNAVRIRYDQGLEEVVNADRLVKYHPRMMPRIKELTAFDKEFTPKIQVPTR